MRSPREAPPYPKVGAEADDEHPLAALRHAVVRRVQHLSHDVVFGAAMACRVMFLKPTTMLAPHLAGAPTEAGIHELQADIFEIGSERLAFEPLDVLENERLRAQLAHSAHGFGKHVALIKVATVFPAH